MSVRFIECETGAVTVDWVVLTAALVGLGLAAMLVISGGVEDVANDTSNQLQGNNIIQTTFVGSGGSSEPAFVPTSYNSYADFAVCDQTQVDAYSAIEIDNYDWLLGNGDITAQEAEGFLIADVEQWEQGIQTFMDNSSGYSASIYDDQYCDLTNRAIASIATLQHFGHEVPNDTADKITRILEDVTDHKLLREGT